MTTVDWRIGAGVGAAVILAVAGFWYYGTEEEAPPVADTSVVDRPEEPTPPAPPPPPAREPIELPPLDESDALVRELAAAISAHPEWVAWLVTDHLIRTFVVVVDNVAEGTNPAQHVPFARTDSRFETEMVEGRLLIADTSHRRYDRLTGIVASIDAAGSARLYRDLLPLMGEAYAELGAPPDVTFMDTFQRAVSRLLEAPVIEGRPEVVPRGPFVVYTDPTLERLSPAAKQLMWVGPENLRTIQAKVREIAEAIGVPDLPRGSVLLR